MLLLLMTCAQADPLGEAIRVRLQPAPGLIAAAMGRSLETPPDPLERFYRARHFRPVWLDPRQRRELIDAVEDSASHGLEPADYRASDLQHWDTLQLNDVPGITERDLLFSDALLRLATHLRHGKLIAAQMNTNAAYYASRETPRPEDLAELLDAPDLYLAIMDLAPHLDAYTQLRAELARYRRYEAEGGWESVPNGPALGLGMKNARVPALRRRLSRTDPALPRITHGADVFDQALLAAVLRFQVHHGLAPDGRVGRKTRRALNVEVVQRIAQIRANLERLRWMAPDLAADHLIVDITAYEARLMVHDRLQWESRAIVGRVDRPTPVFRALLRDVVLNPTWIVPPTILREDVLPKLVANPAYLEAHHLHVEDAAGKPIPSENLPWSDYQHRPFPYQLVQAPGEDNPVGRIKFVLPNVYAVYLHDTPQKNLFDRHERAFSSGCIRLRRPLELAEQVLSHQAGWPKEAIKAAIDTGETQKIVVEHPIPVLVAYLTAAIGSDGTLHFRDDIYQRDGALIAALDRPVVRAAPRGRPEE